MKHLYVDTEFSTIREYQKFQQVIIAIGAVLVNENKQILDTFYSLACPRNFRKLGKTVKDMTKLDNEMILHAPSFPQAFHDMEMWLDKWGNEELQIYSFGPDDYRTLTSDLNHHHIHSKYIKQPFIDLQKIISASITYKGETIAPVFSLENLKLCYGVLGEVEHHALSDALDLMKLHQSYDEQKPCNQEYIKKLYDQKIEKQKKLEEQRIKKMNLIVKEEFPKKEERFCLSFTKETKALIERLQRKDSQVRVSFDKEYAVIDHQRLPLSQLKIILSFQMTTYSYCLEWTTQDISIKHQYPIDYHNIMALNSLLRYAKRKKEKKNRECNRL